MEKSIDNKKAPASFDEGLFLMLGQRLTLPGFTLVPSALVVLTALFGMGRGGPHRHSRLKFLTGVPGLSTSTGFKSRQSSNPGHPDPISLTHRRNDYRVGS